MQHVYRHTSSINKRNLINTSQRPHGAPESYAFLNISCKSQVVIEPHAVRNDGWHVTWHHTPFRRPIWGTIWRRNTSRNYGKEHMKGILGKATCMSHKPGEATKRRHLQEWLPQDTNMAIIANSKSMQSLPFGGLQATLSPLIFRFYCFAPFYPFFPLLFFCLPTI